MPAHPGGNSGIRVDAFLSVLLIGVSGVKLFLLPSAVPIGHSLLFAVGARPPHDGVRKTRRLNVSRDLRGIAAYRLWILSEIASPIVPTKTTRLRRSGGDWGSSRHAAVSDAVACLVQRNSVPSVQIRCRITASRLPHVRAPLRRLAMVMPQDLRADHLVAGATNLVAPVWSAADQQRMSCLIECGRASSSPHWLIRPWTSVSRVW